MLAELVDYYDQLIKDHPNEVAPMGWCSRKVSYVLEISEHGELLAVVPIDNQSIASRIVPFQAEPTSQIAASFLCGSSAYFLGAKAGRDAEWSAPRFKAARELHHQILNGVNSIAAHAILSYFDSWDPELNFSNSIILNADKKLLMASSIVFSIVYEGKLIDPLKEQSIRSAWNSHNSKSVDDDSAMRCLVTGEYGPVELKHPLIRGITGNGAKSSGAKLVSFNERAFESYGHENEQGRNAPVSEHAAQAYATALNYLLSDCDHHIRLGDTTIVYWSKHSDKQNSRVFTFSMGGGQFSTTPKEKEDTDRMVNAVMKSIAQGKYRELDGVDPEATFYVLGLAPSAARLSVKFFLRNTFGTMLDNLADHYRRTDIIHAPQDTREFLTPYQLLREVENPNSKKPVVTPILNGPLLQSMLQNTPYPQALYTNALLRIHATQEDPDAHVRKITRGRAAIVRAFLIKNYRRDGYDERSLTVELNEERNETAYCLGRAFSILEWIQESANGKATITNRYFNSASTTPSVVFPTLIHLSQAHLQKVKRDRLGYGNWLEQQLNMVLGEERVQVFPRRLTLNEQGDFILGYIHQKNKRYEPKSDKANISDEEE